MLSSDIWAIIREYCNAHTWYNLNFVNSESYNARLTATIYFPITNIPPTKYWNLITSITYSHNIRYIISEMKNLQTVSYYDKSIASPINVPNVMLYNCKFIHIKAPNTVTIIDGEESNIEIWCKELYIERKFRSRVHDVIVDELKIMNCHNIIIWDCSAKYITITGSSKIQFQQPLLHCVEFTMIECTEGIKLAQMPNLVKFTSINSHADMSILDPSVDITIRNSEN